ncbi:MAG: hypothetical protein OXF27_08825, partial [Acidobacteria bacterium]|nr:hypothetical protein [Acidobacteriota bacterium]
MRKGYLLTALAAAALLAASPGTLWAQVTPTATYGEGGVKFDVPKKVVEGQTATISVSIRGTVDANTATETDIEVTVAAAGADVNIPGVGRATAGETADTTLFPTTGVISFEFPANPGANASRAYTFTKTIELDTNPDRDAENEGITLTATPSATGFNTAPAAVDANLIIDDAQTQAYEFTLNRREVPVEGGATFDTTLRATPAHEDNGIGLVLQVVKDGKRDRDYTFGGDVVSDEARIGEVTPATPGDDTDVVQSLDIQVTTPTSDGNRATDTVTLEVYRGSAGDSSLIASLDVDVADIHGLPASEGITAVAMDEDGNTVTEIMEGGDPVYLTISVDRGSAATRDAKTVEELTIDIQAADAAQAVDFEVRPTRVTLEEVAVADGEQPTDVEIMLSARSDSDVGNEELKLSLVVSGNPQVGPETSSGTYMIDIVDGTMKQIAPKSEDEAYPAIMAAMEAAAGDDGLNPGESFMIMMGDLFTVSEGYTATYRASVVGDAVGISTSSDSLTVDAKSAGEAKVTVTGMAEMASSSFKAEQTVANEASITFPVEVVDKKLVVTLEMPDGVMDGNILEG